MAATLLSEAVANWDLWTVGRVKPGKNVNTIPLQLKGQNVYIQMGLTSDDAHNWVMCNPSVFNGTGAEDRKSILIAAPSQQVEHLRQIEFWVKSKIYSSYPDIDRMWNSAVRAGDCYPPSFRAKIWTGGYNPCRIYDENGQACSMPTELAGLEVVPIVMVNAYVQQNQAGLLLETVALKIIGRKQGIHPTFDFA